MKCHKQGIQKQNNNIHKEVHKKLIYGTTYLRTSSTSRVTVRQRVTIYNSLTRKFRPTHYSALHHKNSTAYHNTMTCRFTPTRPYPNTLSLYLMWSVIFIGHLWTLLGTCFISSPSTATDLRAINSSWPSWSQHTHAVGTSRRPCQNHSGNSQPRSGHMYAGNFRPQISSNSWHKSTRANSRWREWWQGWVERRQLRRRCDRRSAPSTSAAAACFRHHRRRLRHCLRVCRSSTADDLPPTSTPVETSVIFVTKIKTRTRIIGRRFQRTRTRIIVIQKTKTK